MAKEARAGLIDIASTLPRRRRFMTACEEVYEQDTRRRVLMNGSAIARTPPSAVRDVDVIDGPRGAGHHARVADGSARFRLVTIGYQGRSLAGLVRRLVRNDVRLVLDIRQVARSRRPEFNGARIASAVTVAGMRYRHVPRLGSSRRLREHLFATRDFDRFAGLYLAYVRRWRRADVRAVATAARREGTVAILCYESDHAACHRGIVAAEALRTHRQLEVLHL